MAITVEVASTIKIVDGGATVVDREFISSYEITGKVEGDYWLDAQSSSFTLCVKGTNVTTPAIVDPFVVGLSTIRGIALQSEINLELVIDGAATPIQMAEGNMAIAQAEMQTIKISKDDTRTGNVQFIVWGIDNAAFYSDQTMWGPQGDPNKERPRLKPGDRMADGTIFMGDSPELVLLAELARVEDALRPLDAKRAELLVKLAEVNPEKYGQPIIGVATETEPAAPASSKKKAAKSA